MAKKKDFKSISFKSGIIFLVLGVALSVLGIVLNSKGYEGIPDDFNLFWVATGALFLIGLVNVIAKDGIVKSSYIARIVVGALFVVSGIIKANDPLGFSFKLEEYFEPDALNWPFFIPYSLGLSIFIAGSEIVLGLALLTGALARLTSWLLFSMILFFAWLTYFTASCNDSQRLETAYMSAINDGDIGLMNAEFVKAEVNFEEAMKNGPEEPVKARLEALELIKSEKTKLQYDSIYFYELVGKRVNLPQVKSTYRQCVLDCGCFGDALKGSIGRSLTPWESFFKDLILMILIMPILLIQKHIKFNLQNDDVLIISGSLLFSYLVGKLLFGWWFPLLFLLAFFAIYLVIKKTIKRESVQIWWSAITALVLSFAFVFYTHTYLPIKDYRPYAIGNNLQEQMSNGIEGEYDNIFIYKNNASGELVEFTQDFYMGNDTIFTNKKFNSNWEKIDAENTFIKKITKTIKFAIPASIQDFRPIKLYADLTANELESAGIKAEIEKVYDQYFETVHLLKDVKYGYVDSVPDAEYDPQYYPLSDTTYAYLGKASRELQPLDGLEVNFTQHLFSLEKCILITSYKLGELIESGGESKEWQFVNEEKWMPIIALINEAKAASIPVYVITSAPKVRTDEFCKKLGFEADFLAMDPIEIKIMIRSNPGVLYIEKAVVKGKWDYNHVPRVNDLK